MSTHPKFKRSKHVKHNYKKSLNKIAAISNKYKVKLIVLFNPVACSNSIKMSPIITEIEEFKKSHPEVLIPFDFITTVNKKQFGDQYLDYNIGLYPFVFYRDGPIPNSGGNAEQSNEHANTSCIPLSPPDGDGCWCKQPITDCLNPNLGYWVYVLDGN